MFGEGNGTPLQCSCLENPMDGGARWAVVQGVAKSQTRLSDLGAAVGPDIACDIFSKKLLFVYLKFKFN